MSANMEVREGGTRHRSVEADAARDDVWGWVVEHPLRRDGVRFVAETGFLKKSLNQPADLGHVEDDMVGASTAKRIGGRQSGVPDYGHTRSLATLYPVDAVLDERAS
jgi:hypothetical protein